MRSGPCPPILTAALRFRAGRGPKVHSSSTRRIRRQTSAFVVSSVALSAPRQQCLNFLPLPQGQGSLRPGFMALEIYGGIDDPSGPLGQADVESESEEIPLHSRPVYLVGEPRLDQRLVGHVPSVCLYFDSLK